MARQLNTGVRHPLVEAWRWIEAETAPLPACRDSLAEALGRVLGAPVSAPADMPPTDRAACDGFALNAAATEGAGAYNPLMFSLTSDGPSPRVGGVVAPGDPMPSGCDCVLPITRPSSSSTVSLEVIEVLTQGENVWRRGAHWTAGDVLARAGTPLSPYEMARLATAGITEVEVHPAPRVGIVLVPGVTDHLGAVISALVARDGGRAFPVVAEGRDAEKIAVAFDMEVDALLVIGGSGPGPGDAAALALERAGHLALHGLAMRPGETAGLGKTSTGRPVCLLPGMAAETLCAYDLLAARLLRRLAGLPPRALYTTREVCTRKVVSEIGTAQLVPVARDGNGVRPLASFAEAGLGALTEGMVLFNEGSEGCPEGSELDVMWIASRDGMA